MLSPFLTLLLLCLWFYEDLKIKTPPLLLKPHTHCLNMQRNEKVVRPDVSSYDRQAMTGQSLFRGRVNRQNILID